MMGLSDGRKSFPIGLAVLIQYRSVTASQPPSHPASQPPSHVAVAITLNAQASSLKGTMKTEAGVLMSAWRDHIRGVMDSEAERFEEVAIVKCDFAISPTYLTNTAIEIRTDLPGIRFGALFCHGDDKILSSTHSHTHTHIHTHTHTHSLSLSLSLSRSGALRHYAT